MPSKNIVRRLETYNFQIEVTGQKNYEMAMRAIGNMKVTFLPPIKPNKPNAFRLTPNATNTPDASRFPPDATSAIIEFPKPKKEAIKQ
jgi:hypothetical protein